jgi:hypothetical protein
MRTHAQVARHVDNMDIADPSTGNKLIVFERSILQ